MSGSELTMRRRLVKLLRDQGLAGDPVENVVGVGMPDVAYAGGWIECKRLARWPKRASTPVRLHHPLLPSQQRWIKRHAACGGRVHVLIQIDHDFVLLGPDAACTVLGKATREELIASADLYCSGWSALGDLIVGAITC